MNIIDIIILLLLLYGAIMGFKKGFTSAVISFVGLSVVLLLAYFFKDAVSKVLYSILPFFKFGGLIKGATVLNIVLYELIAFGLVFSVLMIVFRVVLLTSKIFEKILKATIILGIPSKLLGMVVGLMESFVLVFILLFALSLPIFDSKEINESKYKDKILTSVPVLDQSAKKVLTITEKFTGLKEKYQETKDANTFNLETLDLFLEYKVISVSNAQDLIQKGKLDLKGSNKVLDKYR
ncbi:MAG: CvpA family protein [Bacilli bacterium]|nr:CvpA family protein [Bacilli bacterium]